jgi:Glutamyl- and glutaminyl-tRNA synthetases
MRIITERVTPGASTRSMTLPIPCQMPLRVLAIPSARLSLKTIVRFTTGWWKKWPRRVISTRRSVPHQYEFARLNLTYVVLSKRKLIELVDTGVVKGWDDPRMPSLVAARRRGYTPEGFRQFVEQSGVSKSDGWIDYTVLEDCMRNHLNDVAPRRVAVLDPLKLVIENLNSDEVIDCEAPNHPQKPELGRRAMPLTRELYIEHEDFMVEPSKGFFACSLEGVFD